MFATTYEVLVNGARPFLYYSWQLKEQAKKFDKTLTNGDISNNVNDPRKRWHC